jgi:hypothetical protein
MKGTLKKLSGNIFVRAKGLEKKIRKFRRKGFG